MFDNRDLITHLTQFAAHQDVQIVAIDTKESRLGSLSMDAGNPRALVVKKLDIAHLPSEKLKKYHEEGRIAFILDGSNVQFNRVFAEKYLVDAAICRLEVKPVSRNLGEEALLEILEGVSIEHLSQAEYDEIYNVCLEVLASFQTKKEEDENTSDEEKAFPFVEKSYTQGLKHLLIRNVVDGMSEISRRFIESMERNHQEIRDQAKADEKKQSELKVRLTEERLGKERLKKDTEKTDIAKGERKEEIISDEKRAALEKKTGTPISEHQA